MYKRKRESNVIDDIHDHSMNNLKYLYQKSDFYSYHCGPFAIYNFLLNYDINIKISKLIKLCDPQPTTGTSNEQMDKAIEHINKKFNIKIVSVEPTLSNINFILESGGKIIFLFHWTHNFYKGEHFALIEKMVTPYKFKFINYSFDEPIKIVSLRELKNMLRSYNTNGDICPTIWTLQKYTL